jgi:hypothetical protein
MERFLNQLTRRLKSFTWRLGVVLAITAVNFIVQDVTSWGLSSEWVVFVGLIGGEVTKYLNTKK